LSTRPFPRIEHRGRPLFALQAQKHRFRSIGAGRQHQAPDLITQLRIGLQRQLQHRPRPPPSHARSIEHQADTSQRTNASRSLVLKDTAEARRASSPHDANHYGPVCGRLHQGAASQRKGSAACSRSPSSVKSVIEPSRLPTARRRLSVDTARHVVARPPV